MLSKFWLLITCFAFALSTSNSVLACDTTPVLVPSNVQSVGGGNYTLDVQACMGINGSTNGFSVSINCGLTILGTSVPSITNGANTASSSISGNTITYNCGGCNTTNWFEPNDFISGPCFNFTLTLNGDPAGCALTMTGVNDGCLIIQTSWSTPIPGPCISNGTINAPGSFSGSTVSAGNTCTLRASTDQVIEINLPCNDTWTFSLCGGSSWDTYLYLGSSCCVGNLGLNDDFCGLQSQITQNLGPGIVYASVEAYSTTSAGTYTLVVTGTNGCPLDVAGISLSAVPKQDENTIDVSWEVEDEANITSYFLERAIENGPFTSLDMREPGGNASGTAFYSFEDWQVKEDEVYRYRVHVHTVDGEQYDTEIVSTILNSSEGMHAGDFYPNPTSAAASIDVISGQEGVVSAQIYDASGRVVAEKRLSVHAGSSTTSLDVSDMPAGIYFVRLTDTNQNTLMRKLVVN